MRDWPIVKAEGIAGVQDRKRFVAELATCPDQAEHMAYECRWRCAARVRADPCLTTDDKFIDEDVVVNLVAYLGWQTQQWRVQLIGLGAV